MLTIRVSFQDKNKRITIPEKSTIEDILKKMGINRETVIVSVNGEYVPETESVKNKDKIKILEITSSG